jgi:hypothetical protein
MRRTPVTLVYNTQLPAAVAAQFTAPSATAPAVGQPASFTYTIGAALFNNSSGAGVTVTVYVVPAGGAAGAANQVAQFTVPAAGAAPTQVPALIGQHLLPGWSLQMFASVAGVITPLISGYLTET